MMDNFNNQVVIVTGAAGALGTAVVDEFSNAGAKVAQLDVVAIDNAHYADTCDLTDFADCQRAVTAILGKFGSIDILANIAGGFAMGETVAQMSADTWNFMFALNAQSVLNMARAVVPSMTNQRHGKIINMSARAALRGAPNMAAYSASKSVVMRLTESLADEVKGDGINVNCILPSIIDSARNRTDMPDADFSKWVRPEQVAQVILFLASGAADAIHGAALPVEGLS